jgi:phosphoglucosamine mutase
MERVPQVLESVKLPSRRPLEEISELIRQIARAEQTLGTSGRVLVRWSGTEPKLRLMLEGPDPDALRTMLGEMADAARRDVAASA